MSVTHETTASFRRQQAVTLERDRITEANMAGFAMCSIRDVSAILAGVTKGASALYISFSSCTKVGPDKVLEASIAAKQLRRPLFTYLRPRLPESALDIDSPAFQPFIDLLPHVDVLELTTNELFYFCPDSAGIEEAMSQICQRFNLKALVVFDADVGSGFVGSREMSEPARIVCRPMAIGNLEEGDGVPSPFARQIIYSFLEQGGTQALLSSRDIASIARSAATSAAHSEPAYIN